MKKFVVILLCCFFSFRINAQNIQMINYVLDSVEYTNYILVFNYMENKIIPDTLKKKMINVLNGYLPPKIINDIHKFDVGELQYMTECAKKKCKKDSDCVRRIKDSLKNRSVEINLNYLKNKEFTPEFILALASWNVHEAKQILLENRNNTKRFPQVETHMALARFGYDDALDSVLNWMSINMDNNDVRFFSSGDYISKITNDFHYAARYLKCKELYFKLLDLFDLDSYDFIYSGSFGNSIHSFPSESIVFEQFLNSLFIEMGIKNPKAYLKLKDIRYKWESLMPTIYDKEMVLATNINSEYGFWTMPAISTRGLLFIENICERRIIIDVDSKTVETIEKICSDDISGVELEHLINVLKTFCADDIDEKDIRCFVEMKQFRQSGLKEQMKAEVREWIDKYVTFDE